MGKYSRMSAQTRLLGHTLFRTDSVVPSKAVVTTVSNMSIDKQILRRRKGFSPQQFREYIDENLYAFN